MNWLRSYLSSSSYTAIREAVIGDVVAFSMWGEGSSYEKYRKNQKMLPTTHDEPASTPLIVAINQRSLAPVKALIKEGADTNASDSTGKTPLLHAISVGSTEMVSLLLDSGADIEFNIAQMKVSTLIICAWCRLVETAQLLLEKGANVNTKTQKGCTGIVFAAMAKNDDMVQLFLRHGADVNLGTCPNGFNALLLAAVGCSYVTVKAILDAGADTTRVAMFCTLSDTIIKDPYMRRLVLEFRKGRRPSWLVHELTARGLEWTAVCDVQDKLTSASLVRKEAFLALSCSQLDRSFLQSLGITDALACQLLIDIRAQSTWLGARLTSLGVSTAGIVVSEQAVCNVLCCATESCFARVLPDELSEEALIRMNIHSGVVRRSLRLVHEHVRADQVAVTIFHDDASRSGQSHLQAPALNSLVQQGSVSPCVGQNSETVAADAVPSLDYLDLQEHLM